MGFYRGFIILMLKLISRFSFPKERPTLDRILMDNMGQDLGHKSRQLYLIYDDNGCCGANFILLWDF